MIVYIIDHTIGLLRVGHIHQPTLFTIHNILCYIKKIVANLVV